jgi:hypothetical protein
VLFVLQNILLDGRTTAAATLLIENLKIIAINPSSLVRYKE